MELYERLDRLLFSRPHVKVLFQGGLGYGFGGADSAIIAFILPVVIPLFAMSAFAKGLMATASLIGLVVGGVIAGWLSDRFGRKQVAIYALLVWAVASLIGAFSVNWEMLFITRLIGGLGTGAEIPVISALAAELVGRRYRGRFIGAIAGFFALGYVFAAGLAWALIPHFDHGWRLVQLVLFLPVLMILWWRRSLPESPRYLLSRGRYEEAEATVANMERRVEQATHRPLPPASASSDTPLADNVDLSDQANRNMWLSIGNLWTPKLARRTAVLWVIWFVQSFTTYGFNSWIPTLLVASGFALTKSFLFSFIIFLGQIPGYYLGALVLDHADRRWTMIVALIGAALSAGGLATSGSYAAILIFGFLLSAFIMANSAAMYTYTPEIYPTRVRAVGMGAASAFGHLGAIVSPFLIGLWYESLGFVGIFGMLCGVVCAGVLVVLLAGERTKRRGLEDIARSALLKERTHDRPVGIDKPSNA